MPETLGDRLAKIAARSLIRHAVVGFLSAGLLNGVCLAMDAMDVADAHDAFDAADAANACSAGDVDVDTNGPDSNDLGGGSDNTPAADHSDSGNQIHFTGLQPGDPIPNTWWDLDNGVYYLDWESYKNHDGTNGYTLDALKHMGLA